MNEKEKAEKLMDVLLERSLANSGEAYLKEFKERCRKEANIARNGMDHYKKYYKDKLAETDKTYHLDQLHADSKKGLLTEDGRKTMDAGDAERKKIVKEMDPILKSFQGGSGTKDYPVNNPFNDMYNMMFELANKSMTDPNLDIGKAFDELDYPENLKIGTLFFLKDYAKNSGIPFAELEVGAKAKTQNQADYQRKIKQIGDYGAQFGATKSVKDKDGANDIKSDIFSDSFNTLVNTSANIFTEKISAARWTVLPP